MFSPVGICRSKLGNLLGNFDYSTFSVSVPPPLFPARPSCLLSIPSVSRTCDDTVKVRPPTFAVRCSCGFFVDTTFSGAGGTTVAPGTCGRVWEGDGRARRDTGRLFFAAVVRGRRPRLPSAAGAPRPASVGFVRGRTLRPRPASTRPPPPPRPASSAAVVRGRSPRPRPASCAAAPLRFRGGVGRRSGDRLRERGPSSPLTCTDCCWVSPWTRSPTAGRGGRERSPSPWTR